MAAFALNGPIADVTWSDVSGETGYRVYRNTGPDGAYAQVGWVDADVTVPPNATGIVLFAHGSGSSRHSPRNRFVAEELNGKHLATVLADLLTREEEAVDEQSGALRFDIPLLTGRLVKMIDWRSGPVAPIVVTPPIVVTFPPGCRISPGGVYIVGCVLKFGSR